VRAFASAYAYDVDSCSQLRRRLRQRQPSSQRYQCDLPQCSQRARCCSRSFLDARRPQGAIWCPHLGPPHRCQRHRSSYVACDARRTSSRRAPVSLLHSATTAGRTRRRDRSPSAGAHGLPLPSGRTLHRFRQRYPCSADDPGWRHHYAASGGSSSSPGDHTYGGSSATPGWPATDPSGRHPYSSPSPISARRPPRPSPSPARRPAACPTLLWPPRPRRPGSLTPADEDPAPCPLSASAGAAIPGSAAPTPYGGGMAHA
jgi:hypothetical protein